MWALLQWADLWWPSTFFLFAPRWLSLLPLLALLPAAWLLRRKIMLVPLALTAVVIVGPVTGLCLPWRTAFLPAPSGPRIRVLTCNLHNSKEVDQRGLESLVLDSGADVVALQEWPGGEASSFAKWPGWHSHASRGLFLASQFPIRQVVELGTESEGPKGLVSRYDLETPVGMVHFFSLHLASPRDSIYETIHDNGNGEEVTGNTARRWEQSEYIAQQIEGLQSPVLLAGDFNTPPESAIFREVWGNYSDAFGVAGWGWGYTFSGGKTQVRIDHVLSGTGWQCRRCWVGPYIGSPHRPVFAEVFWSGATADGK
jgi:endonuclease/exonuclease/phosphatase (EEP) superfamily protein YafD